MLVHSLEVSPWILFFPPRLVFWVVEIVNFCSFTGPFRAFGMFFLRISRNVRFLGSLLKSRTESSLISFSWFLVQFRWVLILVAYWTFLNRFIGRMTRFRDPRVFIWRDIRCWVSHRPWPPRLAFAFFVNWVHINILSIKEIWISLVWSRFPGLIRNGPPESKFDEC